MDATSADEGAALAAAIVPLLGALEGLLFLARHAHPPEFLDVLDAIGTPEDALKAGAAGPDAPLTHGAVGARVRGAREAVLSAFADLRAAALQDGDMRAVLRALRKGALAQEMLYPLASASQATSRFFLSAALREDAGLITQAARPAQPHKTGLIQFGETASPRGSYALFVPETYTPDKAWPLVVALHGGSGNGRLFLWNWLRDARGRGAILLAPTAIGATWSLLGEDVDTPNILQMVAQVRSLWTIDAGRILLTGMSDGGTFTYVCGLQAGSPFTHLAPVAATFHPFLVQSADRARVKGLPIFITHGVLDWMFPVESARMARMTFDAFGAQVVYREIEDLSHCYPSEINDEILSWVGAGAG